MKILFTEKLRNVCCYTLHLVSLSIFKKKCRICADLLTRYEEVYICTICKTEIEDRDLKICVICSIPLTEENSICGQCILKAPPFKRHLSYSIYKDKLRKLILQYKLSGIEPLKNYIAGLYLKLYDENPEIKCDLIVAVPSDPGRKNEFEPVLEIAKIISKRKMIPLSTGNLIKCKHTDKQTSLNYNKRLKNLNGAFKIMNRDEIKGKKILIIDDVYTTGTTIRKCSKLVNRDAKEVFAVTLARSSNIFQC